MATNLPDLWPDDIAVTNDLKSPVTILRQQAALLGEKTQNLVEAEVSSQVTPGSPSEGSYFTHQFSLVAPALDNYKFRLFYIRHLIDFYPIRIWKEGAKEIQVGSEQEFIETLREIFSSEETKRVIRALIAQSQA